MASSLSNTCPVCSGSIVLPKPIRTLMRRMEQEILKRSQQNEELEEGKEQTMQASILSVLMEQVAAIACDSHRIPCSTRELYDAINYAIHDRSALIVGQELTPEDCEECGQPRVPDGWLRTVFRLCLANIIDDIGADPDVGITLREECIIGLQHASLVAVLAAARGIGRNKITENQATELAREIAEFTVKKVERFIKES
jgi:hypothetical protein